MERLHCKVLIVDDDEGVLLAARLLLKQYGATVHTEKDPERIPLRLKTGNYHAIFLDMNFQDKTGGREGFIWLENIQAIRPDVPVILITAFGNIDMAVKAVKQGATDFILKPWDNEKLIATLRAALEPGGEADHAEAPSFEGIIGHSPAMRQVFTTIRKVAATDANVLILGENGTGKEMVAQALHRASPRAGSTFTGIDMGSIPENLFEAELFGYEKGAFTDAKKSKPGTFELTRGGTLFLDEIGNLPATLQARMLRVLETRTVTRLGASRSIAIDIRLVCATNSNIHEMVAQNHFRQDLLYRINTVEIHLPPLRDRPEDLDLLADAFLRHTTKKYKKAITGISDAARRTLKNHRWPGNVRELKHALERAVILSDATVLQPGDFSFPSHEASGQDSAPEQMTLEEMEKTAILKALDQYRGNMSRVARELGLTRASLYRRMEKYDL